MAGAFFAGAFLAGAFLAAVLLAGAFFAGAFLAVVFEAGAFVAVVVVAGVAFVGVVAAAFRGSGVVVLSLVVTVHVLPVVGRRAVGASADPAPPCPNRPTRAPSERAGVPSPDYWRRVTWTSTNMLDVPEPEKIPESGLTSL